MPSLHQLPITPGRQPRSKCAFYSCAQRVCNVILSLLDPVNTNQVNQPTPEPRRSLIRRVSKYVRQLFGRFGRAGDDPDQKSDPDARQRKPFRRRQSRVFKIFICGSMPRVNSNDELHLKIEVKQFDNYKGEEESLNF